VRLFELSVALKYLIPKKKQLSVSLIALMSVTVISLVVWLLLVFLSITEGMEKNWLKKLTSLNAPIRITPQEAYFSSYYYQVDSISAASGYAHKSIAEKASSKISNPYDASGDVETPLFWPSPDRLPDGSLKDPVKIAYQTLQKTPGVSFQDYEIGGTLFKLQMRRPESGLITARGGESLNVLTQASYLATLSDQNPNLSTLLSPPSAQDINTLFYLANRKGESPFLEGDVQARLQTLCNHVQISQLKTVPTHFSLPHALLPEGRSFAAEDRLGKLVLTTKNTNGKITKQKGKLLLISSNGTQRTLSSNDPLFVEEPLSLQANLIPASIQKATELKDLRFNVKGSLQGHPISGELPWNGVEVQTAQATTQFENTPKAPPPWIYQVKNRVILPKNGVLVAKNFQESGVRIGDQGHLSYAAVGSSSVQEQRSGVYVAGFYDPGVLSIGVKCIFAHPGVVAAARQASSAIDKTQSTGIQVWFNDLSQAEEIKAQLTQAFTAAGIDSYWKITTFREYDFAKDLLEQFQSDKTLFTLLGVIILTIACCNIISLLVLLVNDKKKEIGILQAMGASRLSIAAIFGSCGVLLGALSSLVGVSLALLTLHYIDQIVHFLNFVQGHQMFHSAFYGASLPNLLSHNALVFVLIATPILSLLAGLIPAIKACRFNPSSILRSE
jgi:lipoprotein-releasing system permease protein